MVVQLISSVILDCSLFCTVCSETGGTIVWFYAVF